MHGITVDDMEILGDDQVEQVTQVKVTSELQTIQEDKESEQQFERLKDVTIRLNLKTTRPSYVEWRDNLHQFYQKKRSVLAGQNGVPSKTERERMKQITQTLQWLREELIAMKSQDHALAMQLMQIRSQIQQVKLEKSCEEHQDLIDDKRYSLTEEIEDEKLGLCDLPITNNNDDLGYIDPLKDIGVTKMNLSSRRFSIF